MAARIDRKILPRFLGFTGSNMSMMVRAFEAKDEHAVVELWSRCGLIRPTNDPHADVQRKLRVRPDLFLVGVLEGEIVASVMAGYEGHRGWLNYVAVDPAHQRQGLGKAIIAHAEARLRESGCPKINLQVRTGNHVAIDFWERIGYARDDVVSMGKRLANDRPPS